MDGLAQLLGRIEAGELGDPLPVLAYIAGTRLELGAAELNGARRRALLLRAAAGDPRRALDVDDRAARALATDLHSALRLEELAAGLDELAPLVRELPQLREAVVFLASDLDLAWRLFMVGLLAEELGDEEDEL